MIVASTEGKFAYLSPEAALGEDVDCRTDIFAVSEYDIATIVQATMREKENARLAQGSFIHKLIEEALFEFTSLRGDRQSDPAAPSGILLAASACPRLPSWSG